MQGLGILILAVGLALKLRTTVVVVVAAVVTGLAVGVPLESLIAELGKSFVDSRLLSLFLLTLPVVGLCERYGLREQAAAWVRQGGQNARVGRLLWGYQLFRVTCGFLGLRVNGHPGMVRPLLAPMAAAASPTGEPDGLKAASAAAENYGNFYGQNLSPVAPGLLLVYGILKAQGLEVDMWGLVGYACVPVGFSLILGFVQFRRVQ